MIEPVAPGMASTVPSKSWSKASTEIVTDWPVCICFNWLSLKLAVTHKIAQVGQRDEALALADVLADFHRALAYDAGHRRNDLAIAEIELRAVERCLHGLYVGLLGLQIRAGNCHLIGRVHLGGLHHAARLVELRLALVHHFLRGLGRGARGIDGSGECFGCPHHLVVFRPRNFVLVHQRLVARNVGLGLGVIRLHFQHARLRGQLVPLGGCDRGFGVRDFRFGRRNAGLRSALRDGQVRIFRALAGLRLQQLRLRLLDGNLVIARIQFNEQVARPCTDWFSST